MEMALLACKYPTTPAVLVAKLFVLWQSEACMMLLLLPTTLQARSSEPSRQRHEGRLRGPHGCRPDP